MYQQHVTCPWRMTKTLDLGYYSGSILSAYKSSPFATARIGRWQQCTFGTSLKIFVSSDRWTLWSTEGHHSLLTRVFCMHWVASFTLDELVDVVSSCYSMMSWLHPGYRVHSFPATDLGPQRIWNAFPVIWTRIFYRGTKQVKVTIRQLKLSFLNSGV